MIRIEFTVAELELLTSLASDQLFRREFIDPRMPGYKPDSEGIHSSKALINRLRSLIPSNRPIPEKVPLNKS